MDRRKFVRSVAIVGGSAYIIGCRNSIDGLDDTDETAHARAVTAANPYQVRIDVPKQVIWGLGVEIQSDSLDGGSVQNNASLHSVPHDLIASERTRLATDLIGRGYGFRYIRLAGGLYYRGLRNGNKNLDGRWSTQLSELASLIATSGAEGVDFEYWSPPTFWKSNGEFGKGTLKNFTTSFLQDFGDAVVEDIRYLNANGIPVKKWSLQNEPFSPEHSYGTCKYTEEQYVTTFNIVAPKVRAAFPNIYIHANSWDGQNRPVIRNGINQNLVDAWSWHRVGADSNLQIDDAATFNANKNGKPVFNTEFEYLDGDSNVARMMNTAQSIMNWFAFEDSPTWYWLHALKSNLYAGAPGYGLGMWREPGSPVPTAFPNLQEGHFDYFLTNWRAIVGFLEWMPWNSRRYQVDEFTVRKHQRILAFKQGGDTGKLVIVITNRWTENTFSTNIQTGLGTASFKGYRYSETDYKTALGTLTGPIINANVAPLSIDFWVQN